MSFTLTLLTPDYEISSEGWVDFRLEGSASDLYEIMDDAIEKYGDNFMCGDMKTLNYYAHTRGAKAKAEMSCRFLDPRDAMLWKLSLPTD